MKIKLTVKGHFFLIAAMSAVLILLFSFSFDIFQYGDNCGYMTLGIAFANGEGFTDAALPGSPHFLWWPPGFPLFIALFYKIIGPQWQVLKLLIFIMLYVSFALYAQVIYEQEKKYVKTAAILLALCFSSGVRLLSSYLYSEIFYIICSLIFFFVWYKWKDRLTSGKIVLLSLFAIYISSVRLIGMSLPVALAFYLLFFTKGNKLSKRYSIIPIILLAIYIYVTIFVSPFKVDSFHATIGLNPQFSSAITGTYTGDQITTTHVISHYANMLTRSLRGYGFTLIPQALIRNAYDMFEMNKLKAVIMAIVTSFVIIGWYVTLRKNRLMNIYVLLYMSVLFVHGPLYVRLVVPIIPFLFLYFYNGLERVVSIIIKKEHIAAGVLIVLWAGVVFDNAFLSFTDPYRTMPPQFGDNGYQECIEWIVDNTREEEVVVSQVNSYLFLRRGKYCLPYFGAETLNEIITYLDIYKVKYLIISPFYSRSHYAYMEYVIKIVEEYPEGFKRVFEGENGESYVVEYYPQL